MPLLSEGDLVAMRSVPPEQCTSCGNWTARNYCRRCDEFFTAGHVPAPDCGREELKHRGHRTY